MNIRSAEFGLSAASPRRCPTDGLPQVAFAGRSNVGKSSLINCLVNRKGLARTSSTPGRTREINFFLINGEIWFVDLPGFGYAKVSEKTRDAWRRLIESYLSRTQALRAIVFLIDARHGPQADDHQLLEWLLVSQVPFVPVLTKADKVPKSRLRSHVARLSEEAPMLGACDPVAFSAKTRLGREAILERIEAHIS